MSSIDLVILGIVLEKPQSAYDIQKDVEYHNLERWTKISIPSVYKKVIQLKTKGYLSSNTIKGPKKTDKIIYSITESGKLYFEQLMLTIVDQDVPILFDFNVVITNLNKIEKSKAIVLIKRLKQSVINSSVKNEKYSQQFSDIPLVGRTIFEQQKLLYNSILDWINEFEEEFYKEEKHELQ